MKARVLEADHSPGQCSRVSRRIRKALLTSLLAYVMVCTSTGFDWFSSLSKDEMPRLNKPLNSGVQISGYAFGLFFAAQRAFIIADSLFLAAGLIGRRTVAFFDVVSAFLGADLPFHCTHLCFMASEMRLRAAALIWRRF